MDPRLNQSGPTLIVLAEHKSPVYDPAGIALVTSGLRRAAPDSLDPKIHHNNMLTSILAKVEANVAGADDALLLDTLGYLAETNATNVFLVQGTSVGDALVRTPTSRACPEGITRDTVLALCAERGLAVQVGDWSLTDVYTADEVFVTGTMGGLTPVVRVDGREIGTGGPGPVTRSLAAAYAQLTARSGTPVVDESP
jgi:branched-chain amino acid aminotransferase